MLSDVFIYIFHRVFFFVVHPDINRIEIVKHVSATISVCLLFFFLWVCYGSKSHWLFSGCKTTASVYCFCIAIPNSISCATNRSLVHSLSIAHVFVYDRNAKARRIRAIAIAEKKKIKPNAWFLFTPFYVRCVRTESVLWIRIIVLVRFVFFLLLCMYAKRSRKRHTLHRLC